MKKLVALRIDPEVWRQLKIAAVTANVTIGEYIGVMIKKEGGGQK
jgi:predicted HicB family RNase H-like nuclease